MVGVWLRGFRVGECKNNGSGAYSVVTVRYRPLMREVG